MLYRNNALCIGYIYIKLEIHFKRRISYIYSRYSDSCDATRFRKSTLKDTYGNCITYVNSVDRGIHEGDIPIEREISKRLVIRGFLLSAKIWKNFSTAFYRV